MTQSKITWSKQDDSTYIGKYIKYPTIEFIIYELNRGDLFYLSMYIKPTDIDGYYLPCGQFGTLEKAKNKAESIVIKSDEKKGKKNE